MRFRPKVWMLMALVAVIALGLGVLNEIRRRTAERRQHYRAVAARQYREFLRVASERYPGGRVVRLTRDQERAQNLHMFRAYMRWQRYEKAVENPWIRTEPGPDEGPAE